VPQQGLIPIIISSSSISCSEDSSGILDSTCDDNDYEDFAKDFIVGISVICMVLHPQREHSSWFGSCLLDVSAASKKIASIKKTLFRGFPTLRRLRRL